MKLTKRVLITTLVSAIALPLVGFAAKGERRKKDKDETPAVAFATVDKDSDASVTQAEYIAALKEKLGEEAAKTRFTALDKDSNGKLTKEEYEAEPAKADKKKERRNKRTTN